MERLLKFLCTILIIGVANGNTVPVELAKTSASVACSNGQLIAREQVCNDIINCEDGSDERYNGTGFKCFLSNPPTQRKKPRCILPQSMIFDDVIDCVDRSDRCFDDHDELIASQCFLCLDGSTTISLTQVCDGVVDCPDLSDECTCLMSKSEHRILSRSPICDRLKFITSLSTLRPEQDEHNSCNPGDFICKNSAAISACLEPKRICNNVIDCPLGDDEEYCDHSAFICPEDATEKGTFCDGRIDCSNFEDECHESCWLSNEFCYFVTKLDKNISTFNCSMTDIGNDSSIQANYVCDGLVNCENGGNDEVHCSAATHFYCSDDHSEFIDRMKYSDGKRDCKSGSDECGDQAASSKIFSVGSRNAIIRSGALIFTVFAFGTMALVGNAAVFRHTSKELWNDIQSCNLGKLAKCNRILVANLAISDFLMGIYLITIGISSIVTDGRYCVNDRQWRSGYLCILLGFVCQLSSQTSVFTIVLMTSFRLYGTLQPFKAERSHVVYCSLLSCAVVWVVSVSLCVIPLVESFSDYFNSHFWIPLPMVPSDVINVTEFRELVIRMNTLTYNKTGVIAEYTVPNMIRYLQNIGIKGIHGSWSASTMRPYGYYNSYPFCMPNFYPHVGEAGWIYSTTIVIFDACSIFYITISYFVIYKASSRPAVRKSVRIRSKQWRKDNKAMQKKILLLVITDVSCWLPICVTAFVNLVRPIVVRRDIVGITGGLLLPINSAMNPLIYSSSFWQVLESIKIKLGLIDNSFETLSKSRENSVVSQSQGPIETFIMEKHRHKSRGHSEDTDDSKNMTSTSDDVFSQETKSKPKRKVAFTS